MNPFILKLKLAEVASAATLAERKAAFAATVQAAGADDADALAELETATDALDAAVTAYETERDA